MKETVPPTMAGITFLSGGQSEEDATLHIQAMAEYMPLSVAMVTRAEKVEAFMP